MYVMKERDPRATVADLVGSITDILDQVRLCSMGRADQEGPWIATMFFAEVDIRTIVVLSDPNSRHFISINPNDSVAVAIFDTNQSMESPKQGLQVVGRVRRLTRPNEVDLAISKYCARFPSATSWLPNAGALEGIDSRPFAIEFDSVKVFDEVRFGSESWMTVDWVHSPD